MLLLAVLLSFMLVSCTSKIDRENLVIDDFKWVKADMTTNKIKERFGEPDEIQMDADIVKEKLKIDNSFEDQWSSEDENLYKNFYGNSQNESKLLKYISERNASLYYYMYVSKLGEGWPEDEFRIYFIDDKVVWMTFR